VRPAVARVRWLGPVAIVLLLAIAVPAGAFPLGSSVAGPSTSPATATPGVGAASPTAVSHPASVAAAANGPGVFFSTQSVPNASLSHLTCYGSTCVNVSNDPSINWTSSGAIAVAYTAWTNDSPCHAAIPYAQSEIGFVASTNGGTSWSTPRYLGAPTSCSSAQATAEPDAWQPSLTSLGNGTLVLVYVAFNSTGPVNYLGLGPATYTVTTDRLLLTESYNNGTTWTAPIALNVSDNPGLGAAAFTAERPSAVATGDTVYVAWMNVTAMVGFSGTPVGSSAVQLLVSTNNGTTWPASPTTLPVVTAHAGISVAMNPNAIVLPSGQLSVAYATNLSYHATYGCQNSTCLAAGWEADVVVASSTNNGSTFSVATAASGVLVAPMRYADSFLDPSPQLAYGGPSTEIALTFAAGEVVTACPGGTCGPVRDSEVIYVANSSTAGATWSMAHTVMDGLWSYGPFGTYYLSFAYNPTIAIDRNGTVDLAFTYDNYTLCQLTLTGGEFCGPQQEVFAQSTDYGATFVGPELVSTDWSQLYNNPSVPDGEYATTVAAGGQLWIAWSLDACPGWASGFYGPFPTPFCYSEVSLSSLVTGPGLTLTFSESGLTPGIPWNVSVMGNARSALAPATLSVSGVPAGASLEWGFATAISPQYGERFAGSSFSSSPSSYTSSTTISVAYTSQVLVNVGTVPSFPTSIPPYVPDCFTGYPATAWDDPSCATMNYNVTVSPPIGAASGPGSTWVSPGTAYSVDVTPIGAYYCTVGAGGCYDNNVLNLTFLSWTGTGNGSVNTTANSTTFVANGPVNETANFLLSGYCYVDYYLVSPATSQCLQDNTSLTFHETGLPAGTAWDVSVSSAFGSTTVTNSTPWNPVVGAATIGPATFQVWTVPGATGYWVPSTTPLSPVQLPVQGLVDVNFTLDRSLAGLSFPLDVSTSGLPAGLPWSYGLNASSYAVASGNSTVTTAPAGSYTVGGSPVEEPNGTEWVVTGVDARSDVVNRSGWSNTSAPGTVTVHGPAVVVLVYSPRYWLDVVATTGGAAGPSDAYYVPGASATLSESALVGYHFTSWTGTGSGATGGAQDAQSAPTIHVNGPITELANFVENASTGDTVTVTESGLPSGAAFSFSIGATGYTANGSDAIGGFTDGPYAFHAENATDLGTGELGEVTAVTSTYTTNPNGTLQVVGDGSVQVNYTVLDLLTTTVVGSGSIEPNTEWVAASSVVTVTATAATGWQFDSLSTVLPFTEVPLSTDTFHVAVNTPGTVVAQFSLTPTGPTPTYTLTVNATGLPSGVVWNVTAGPTGTSGSGSTLNLSGLPAGTYNLTAPTVYVGTGTRYVPAAGTISVTLPLTSPVTVAFMVQYDLSILGGPGGTVGPGSEWVASGTTVTLSETANATEVFLNWTGSGAGSYTGTAAAGTVTVKGPVTEVASFGPTPSSTTTNGSSGSSFPTLGVGLLVVLLIVGAVVGLLLGRRSGGSGPTTSSAPPPADSPEWSEPPPTETIYGGPGPTADDGAGEPPA
jgi:hypothetical protein